MLKHRQQMKNFLSAVGLICAVCVAVTVVINNISDYALTINGFYLCYGLLCGLASPTFALQCIILLLPLLPNLHQQINVIFNVELPILHAPGFELVTGFFIGTLLSAILIKKIPLKNICPPWQIGLVLILITASTALAITRNLWQSATVFSLSGLLYNLARFRQNSWHDDYFPITDWLAYGLAGCLVGVLPLLVKSRSDRNTFVFVPALIGVVMSATVGLVQQFTGLGLILTQAGADRTGIGTGVYGLQPDIHAFAGHMLLGAVGVWGYLLEKKSTPVTVLCCAAVVLAWIGLLISKSRSSILLAIVVTIIFFLIWIVQRSNRTKSLAVALLVFSLATFLFLIPSSISWMHSLYAALLVLDFTDFYAVSTLLQHRPELAAAAIKMWLPFPLLGLGQGEFFRMSAQMLFSGSPFLVSHNGENAHNYFLQTIAETGIIGAVVFAIALFSPFIFTKRKSVIVPAAAALLGLFLGNIFSHSFLVRENLFFAAIFVGLLYSWRELDTLSLEPTNLYCMKYSKSTIIAAAVCVIVLAGALFREVRQSIQTYPYSYGLFCHVSRPLTADGWTSGIYEHTLPKGSRGVTVNLIATQPDAGFRSLTANLLLVDKNSRIIIASEFILIHDKATALHVTIPSEVKSGSDGVAVQLMLSRCFTPRNLGLSADPRRLGVRVASVSSID